MERPSALLWAGCVATFWGLLACGGAFKSDGGGPSGGTGSGGGGGATGRKSCVVGGKTYADGATFMDDCNSCSCEDGEIACDLKACLDTCVYVGQSYREGDSFPAADGCNTCSCSKGGAVSCTEKACSDCQAIAATHAEALDAARECDPRGMRQCQVELAEGLQCSCGAFVNEANRDAIAAAKQAASAYSAAACGSGVTCGQCATAVAGYCSSAGRCETHWQEGPRACKVSGVIYPDGATNIPDPTSCNKCTCKDGALSCTKIDCPTACPPDRVPTTQCALCGPTDACLVVEHACLPTCSPGTDSCQQGSCVDGVCRNVCG